MSVIDWPLGAAESCVKLNGTLVVAAAPFVATTLCAAASVVDALHV